MPAWLIGKMLAPVALLLFALVVGRPVVRVIERRLAEGLVRRILLLSNRRDPLLFGVAWTVLAALLIWIAWAIMAP